MVGDGAGKAIHACQADPEPAAWFLRDAADGSFFGHPSPFDDDDIVGERKGIEDIVGDDDGPAVGEDPFEEPPEHRCGMDVEGLPGFIKKQQLGVSCWSPSNRDALGLRR